MDEGSLDSSFAQQRPTELLMKLQRNTPYYKVWGGGRVGGRAVKVREGDRGGRACMWKDLLLMCVFVLPTA